MKPRITMIITENMMAMTPRCLRIGTTGRRSGAPVRGDSDVCVGNIVPPVMVDDAERHHTQWYRDALLLP